MTPLTTLPPPDEAALRRVEPRRNMARWYALSLEVTLFGDWSCVRSFGRIGAPGGRVMIGLYDDREAALAAFRRLLGAKRRRGYVPR